MNAITARLPRIDRPALRHALLGVWPWLGLLGATAYISLGFLSPTAAPYAMGFGPCFVLASMLGFAWRYADAMEDRGDRFAGQTVVAVLSGLAMAAVPLGLTFGITYSQYKATAPASFAKDVGYAPGYSWDVVAAGYKACGELARGEDPEAVAAALRQDGLNGDLHTALVAARIVDEAHQLCPNV